jgi:TrmH family RNA methyltransferase
VPLITSLQNSRVKHVAKLAKRRVRDQFRQTVVEGAREISRALACGIIPGEAFVCPQLLPDNPTAQAAFQHLNVLSANHITDLVHVTPEVFARMAYRGESGGMLLVIPYQRHTFGVLPESRPRFLALIEGVEKPGNLGAILRTADAAGVDGVIVCATAEQPTTDVHNPNVIRASLGTIFSVPVVEVDTEDALTWLQKNHVRIVAATPDASLAYTACVMTGPTAVALGSEAHGLSERLLQAADITVTIPMFGIADSLNLATSTALMLYEVVRQRATEEKT